MTVDQALPDCPAEFFQEISGFNPFSTVAAPLIWTAIEEIEALFAKNRDRLPAALFSDVTINEWTGFLSEHISEMCKQTLVLEHALYQLTENPDRISPEEFAANKNSSAKLASLYLEYPVLLQELRRFCAQQTSVFVEFINRFANDFHQLASFSGFETDTARITSLKIGAGDFHNDGRSVIIMTFADGNRLVYKPRDVSIEKQFGDILSQFNQQCPGLEFRVLQWIEQENYGWAEFVEPGTCANEDEIQAYYRAAGGLICVAHLLGGYDFHHENLIAGGISPVLIDLETLFYTKTVGTWLGREDPFYRTREYPAVSDLFGSVISTLMLPVNLLDETNSGLSGHGQQFRNSKVLDKKTGVVITDVQPDQPLANQPLLNGKRVGPESYIDEIQAGYETASRFLCTDANRAGFLEAVGKMADCSIRVVLRDTQTYVTLLKESYHPALLSDPNKRLAHFMNLWNKVFETPSSAPIFVHELKQLLEGSVPFFKSTPGSNVLYCGDGQETGYQLGETGLNRVFKRIAAFNTVEYKKQSWIIRASFEQIGDPGAIDSELLKNKVASQRSRRVHDPAWTGSDATNTDSTVSTDLRPALEGTHQALLDLSSSDGEILDWLDIQVANETGFGAIPADLTFYSGMSGISVYLGYYARFSGDPESTIQADKAFRGFQRQIDEEVGFLADSSLMNGLAGVAYSLLHHAELRDQPELLVQSENLMIKAIELDEGNRHFDIISGTAGLCLAALSAYEYCGKDSWLKMAKILVDRLKGQSCDSARGRIWMLPENRYPLSGLSHGQSGVIYTFARYLSHVEDPELRKITTDLVQTENSFFRKEVDNWLDYRWVNLKDVPSTLANESATHFWCNGSAGIFLCRDYLASQKWDIENLTRDREAAARSTLLNGISGSMSLCHGTSGNLDCLISWNPASKLPANLETTYMTMKTALSKDIATRGHRAGITPTLNTPGLLTGLAGLGYGFLRQLAPETVPSILAVQPPATMALEQ